MFVLKKNDITVFPFHECSSLDGEELEKWAETHMLKAFNSWMLPQIVAHYGDYKVTKKDNGLFDPKLLMKDNLTSEWDKGLWKVVNRLKRSALVKVQSNINSSEYSALVPIILSGLKKSKNIPYSAWDRDGIQYTMSAELHEAATLTDYPVLSNSELLEIRQAGLITLTGSSAGSYKNPRTTSKLTGLKDTPLAALPKLVVSMLTQTWVAHPEIRNKYMILDAKDWDSIPEALVVTQVIKEPKVPAKIENGFPWLD